VSPRSRASGATPTGSAGRKPSGIPSQTQSVPAFFPGPIEYFFLPKVQYTDEGIDLSPRTASDELGLSAVPALLFQQVIPDSAAGATTSRSPYS